MHNSFIHYGEYFHGGFSVSLYYTEENRKIESNELVLLWTVSRYVASNTPSTSLYFLFHLHSDTEHTIEINPYQYVFNH